jgi:ABC-2 type transport system permease protein
MIAKIWANGLVIVVVATLSLWLMAHVALQVPLSGATLLFVPVKVANRMPSAPTEIA